MNRILFLDIDGVLCTQRAHYVYGEEGTRWHEWDPLGCQAVRNACKSCRIVISSTWRYDRHKDDLFDQLKRHELFQYIHEDWRTIDMSVRGSWGDINCRGGEIKEWLGRHPEIKSYRILDDVPQFLPDQMPYYIRTDVENGMTADNIQALLRWAGYLKS